MPPLAPSRVALAIRPALVALLSALLALGTAGVAERAASAAPADVQRLFGGPGTGRIETAIALSRDTFGDGSADDAVLAFAYDFPDALAAAPLAAAAGGPVLLNDRDVLNEGVRGELERLGTQRVFLMGGTEVQSQGVEDRLEDEGYEVERVRDSQYPNRFGTARAAVLRAVQLWRDAGDGQAGSRVLVALGAHQDPNRAWPDALASGALAGQAHWPILLTTQERVPEETNRTLDELGTSHATVVGGEAAIPESTKEQLRAGTRDRIGGPTRFATSTLLADEAVARGASRETVIAATGGSFPDGLAAAPIAAARGGVLVLVGGADLVDSLDTKTWVEQHREPIARIRAAGGPVAVSDEVLGQLGFALEDLRLGLQTVASGFEFPVTVVSPPGDQRLFVVERGGRIRIADGGTFLDLTGPVLAGGERGLLGLAFHPAYQSNGLFYVHYTADEGNGDTRLVEYQRASADTADPQPRRVLLALDQPAANHNGGQIEFGPDGLLYVGLGDGGGSGDRFNNAQRRDTLLGAIVRLNVDTGTAQNWMYGLRNPYRFSIDVTDGVIAIGDVGQDEWEEVDIVPLAAEGTNFGWPCREGAHEYDPDAPGCAGAQLTDPVVEYPLHDQGTCAVTGGVVYRGSQIPELRGQYLYADYCAGWIHGFHERNGLVTDRRQWLDSGDNPAGFGVGADGEVYVALTGGTIAKIVRAT